MADTPLTETAERVARVAERCELTSDTSYCDSATGEEVIDSPLQLAADLRSLLAHVAAAEKALLEIADLPAIDGVHPAALNIARAYFEKRHAD